MFASLVLIGTVPEGLGGVAVLEEACHRDRFGIPEDWDHFTLGVCVYPVHGIKK